MARSIHMQLLKVRSGRSGMKRMFMIPCYDKVKIPTC